jgi:hypothetical protein
MHEWLLVAISTTAEWSQEVGRIVSGALALTLEKGKKA